MTEQPLTDLEKTQSDRNGVEDRTTFDAILLQFGLKEQEVIDLMRNEKPKSFIMWRKRFVQNKTRKITRF
jgi:uncharacterized protein (TIGR03643 family)